MKSFINITFFVYMLNFISNGRSERYSLMCNDEKYIWQRTIITIIKKEKSTKKTVYIADVKISELSLKNT